METVEKREDLWYNKTSINLSSRRSYHEEQSKTNKHRRGFGVSRIEPNVVCKVFHGVGHLPSKDNPDVIVQVDFYHSMYENINADVFGFMFPVSIALIAVSVIVSVACLKYSNYKKLQVAGHIIFGITFGVFLLSLFLASTVARGY